MDPCTFQFEVTAAGEGRAGFGVIAAFVPAAYGWPALATLACDPGHDPGRPIDQLVPGAIRYVCDKVGLAVEELCWTTIDAWGRFTKAVPQPGELLGPVAVEFVPFIGGHGVEAFLSETGAGGDVVLEMLSALVDARAPADVAPSAREFLEAVETQGNLPVPGTIFRAVEDAIAVGDARQVAALVQSDPVISSCLVNHANAARFAAGGKTSSVLQGVQRLGMSSVRRIVFVAALMARYRKGRCADFDYQGYWMNSIATGATMRALMPDFGIPARMGDDAFAAGLVSGIGWLAVAETFPDLMTTYLKRCRHSDPLTKIRAQRELFPCPVRMVSERYLERFAFPEIVLATVAGKTEGRRNWGECMAHAIRAARNIAAFDCLAVLPLAQVPAACIEEWESWRSFLADMRA